MNKNRTTYTIKNIIFGILNKILNIVFPFLIRSFIIHFLGTQYLGLNTLFTSILQVLNLAEMGLSSAIIYSMYKPIADCNVDEVCNLLYLYKKIYKKIGIIVLIVGIILIPFLPHLIYGSYPKENNISVLFIIYLINTSLSYFFYAYKASIWTADQKVSMITNIQSFITIIQSIVQIIILVVLKNYLIFLIVMPIFTLFNNLFIGFVSKKYYPQYYCKGDVSNEVKKSIKRRVKGLFITKLCTTTRNALDSIFISALLGLNMVAIYGNYYYIMSAIFGFMSIIITSMTSSIGNSMVKECMGKNYNDMRKFNFSFGWIASFCTICLLCLYQPFMKIWVGEQMMFPFYMVILFCIYFYVLCLGSVRSAYHDAAGLWWEARYRAVLETIVNIVLNYILTIKLGVAGTVLSTIISIVAINYGYGTSIVFKYYFKGISMKQYYLDHFKYTLVTTIVAFITYYICSLIKSNLVIELISRLLCCIFIPNILFYLIYNRNELFQKNKEMFLKIIYKNKN